jgi:pyridoxal phosphate enzyme (YggS family)
MADISSNIISLRSQIPSHIKLVAVSKTKPVSDILTAYNAGQRCFGENRVQEILNKKDLLPDDIEWHLIGHLQTNKVKSVVPFISMIQSVDTFRLLSAINSEASKVSRLVDCLLQIHIAREETKFGFSLDELNETIASSEFKSMENVRICGLMGMATLTSDNDQIQREFRFLADCFRTLREGHFSGSPHFREISMGMSGDYSIALKEGSTMLRIGSLIFGERNTPQH